MPALARLGLRLERAEDLSRRELERLPRLPPELSLRDKVEVRFIEEAGVRFYAVTPASSFPACFFPVEAIA